MNDSFEKKVRSAAVAGWWVILVAIGFLLLQWLIYLAVMSTHPAWLLSMWGAGRRLAFRPTGVVLGNGGVQVLRLAHGFGGPLVDAVGEAVA